MRKLNILSINHHEAYLTSLAHTGHNFFIITQFRSLNLSWNPSSPPPAQNIRLISFDATTKKNLKTGFYDVVICHTIKNLLWFFPYFKQQFIFIGHVTLRNHTAANYVKSVAKKYFLKLFMALHKGKIIMVSPFKQATWGLPAQIIPLTPGNFSANPQQDDRRVIVVGNRIKERGSESGWDLIEYVGARTPLTIVGNNPGIPNAIKPKNYQDFLLIFQSAGIFLFTTRPPFNDGYNTAMLEAMQLGMAVVTVDHPSTPIIHMVNGLIAKSKEELVSHINLLLNDRDLCLRLGTAATLTIEENFSLKNFTEKWQQVLKID